MSVLLVLLGKAIRLGSIAAYVYLLWNGRWLVIVTAIGFSFLTPAITALVNLPMGVFWKELGYPEALTTPSLQLLVNPVRLLMVSRIPQLVYGGLAYAIGLAAFLLFSSSSHALERAALMITGDETGFQCRPCLPPHGSHRVSRRVPFSVPNSCMERWRFSRF